MKKGDILPIDRSRLFEEAEQVNSDYFDAVVDSAQADTEVRDADLKLKVVEAEVYSELKGTPDPNTGKPRSEAAVKALIPSEPEYMNAFNELTKKKADAKVLNGAMESYSMKKTILAKMMDAQTAALGRNLPGDARGANLDEGFARSMGSSS